MVGVVCGVKLRDRRRSRDLMLMLGLNETVEHLVMASSVHWYGHVLRSDDSYVLRRALDVEVEGQRKKVRLKRTWKKQVEEESVFCMFVFVDLPASKNSAGTLLGY